MKTLLYPHRAPFVLSRRTILRGSAGGLLTWLALPRLEAMLDGHGSAYADGAPLPKFFVQWFWGNGIDPKRWVPSATGANWAPSEQLMPFTAVKDYLSVVTNHTLSPPRFNEPHVNGPVGILTGDDFMGTGFGDGTVKRPSLDQVIAAQVGTQTRFKSIEVRINAYHMGGTAIDHISHNGPGNPNRGEIDPKIVFDRLFGGLDPSGAARDPEMDLRGSVLDTVLEDMKALRLKLGSSDQQKLDQHADGIRTLEKRIAVIPPGAAQACQQPPAPVTAAAARARSDAMSQLVAAAVACDLVRVVSFEFTTPASHVLYPDIMVKEDIHEWGHVHGVDDTVNRAIVFFMENFAAFLGALKNTKEGAGNLLDRGCIFGTSCTAYGPTHQTKEWPLLIAGRAGGALKYPGIHLRPAAEDNASRLPLTILKAMGVNASEWGVGSLATNKVLTDLLA